MGWRDGKMKGVIDGIIRTEHISLNRAVGFKKRRLSANSSLVLRGRTNTRTHTQCAELTRVFKAGVPQRSRAQTHTAIISSTAVMRNEASSFFPHLGTI